MNKVRRHFFVAAMFVNCFYIEQGEDDVIAVHCFPYCFSFSLKTDITVIASFKVRMENWKSFLGRLNCSAFFYLNSNSQNTIVAFDCIVSIKLFQLVLLHCTESVWNRKRGLYNVCR